MPRYPVIYGLCWSLLMVKNQCIFIVRDLNPLTALVGKPCVAQVRVAVLEASYFLAYCTAVAAYDFD